MTTWRGFGASVRGPAHCSAGLPNQDSWRLFHHAWADGVVVSDGVGSKMFSDRGAWAACASVECAVKAWKNESERDWLPLLHRIQINWLTLVAPLLPADCSATCLFAVVPGNGRIYLGMLGDGIIAVLGVDGAVVVMADHKLDGFSNTTLALSERLSPGGWQCLSIPEDDCAAVLLCTDGVADDLEDIDGFVKSSCLASIRFAGGDN